MRPLVAFGVVAITVLAGLGATGSGTQNDEAMGSTAVLSKPAPPLRAALSLEGPLALREDARIVVAIDADVPAGLVSGRLAAAPGVRILDGGAFELAVDAGSTAFHRATIQVMHPGLHEIEVALESERAGVASDVLFVDAAAEGVSASRANPRSPRDDTLVVVEHVPPPRYVHAKGGPPGADVALAGTLSLSITLRVDNWDNTRYTSSDDNQPMRSVFVELWDREQWPKADYFMGSGYASNTGYISFSVNNDDGFGQGTLDPYIKVYSKARPSGQSSDKASIVNPDNNALSVARYDWGDNLGDGTYSVTFKPNTAVSAAPWYILSRAVQAYNKAVEGGVFTPPP